MHKTSRVDRRKELSLFDPDSRRSLHQMLPEGFSKQIENFWNSEQRYLLSLGEREFCKEVRRLGFDPGTKDYHLRHQFWQEYDSVQVHGSSDETPRMNMSKVLRRVIPKETFYRDYITDMRRLAWLLTPPVEYKAAIEAALYKSIERLVDILEAPIQNPNGTLSLKTAKTFMEIQKMLFAQLQFMTGKSNIAPGKVSKPLAKGETDEDGTSGPALGPISIEDKLMKLLEDHQRVNAEKQFAGIGQERPPKLEDV